MQAVRTWLLLAAMTVLATACDSGLMHRKFQATDITGVDFGRDFHLTDHLGKPRSLVDFKGKVVAIFFGYVYCPDVCPTTMFELASALKQLGADAKRVQVLFITVDPERDKPELLARYMAGFDPGFLALSGTPAQIAATAKEFKVFYQKEPGESADTYTVSHSAGTYIYDTAGHLRLLVAYGRGTEVFSHDIQVLLSEQPKPE
jgi:protein SCO1/2